VIVIKTATGASHEAQPRRRRPDGGPTLASVLPMTPAPRHPAAPGPTGALDVPALSQPETTVGPAALDIRLGAPAVADGWTWWALDVPLGLDGPPGVLQGGIVTGLTAALAQRIDPHGAPLHAVTARLEAPTLLGHRLVARARPGEDAGVHEVEWWAQGRRLVHSRVELTGVDPLHAVSDLVALADVPLPEPRPDPLYPSCFVCGPGATHPAALHTYPAWVTRETLSIPWVPEAAVAVDGTDRVDPIVVAAALDCPTAWAAIDAVRAQGFVGVLLGTMRLRVAAPVEVADPVRITARLDAIDGRKARARSAVVDSDGRVLAMVEATHLAVRALPEAG